MTTTSTVGSDARKKYATALPITPPPTITTCDFKTFFSAKTARAGLKDPRAP